MIFAKDSRPSKLTTWHKVFVWWPIVWYEGSVQKVVWLQFIERRLISWTARNYEYREITQVHGITE